MKLDEFLTQGLTESLQNSLIPPELVTIYAGNYLAKSLITQDDMTKIQTAVTAYKAAQVSADQTAADQAQQQEANRTPASEDILK